MNKPSTTLLKGPGPFVVVALALAGCGGGSGEPSDAAALREKNRDALLKFARCMRENGVDMPDPAMEEGGGFRILQEHDGANAPSEAELRAAEEKCAKYREAVTPPRLSEEQRAEMRERALAHAKCMRENGIDFPDPNFEEGGRITQRVGPGGVDPRDPDFREADERCHKRLGGRGRMMPAPGANP